MVDSDAFIVARKLERLRLELLELAFSLEHKGQLDAADVAITTSAKVGELCEELAAPSAREPVPNA